MWRTVCIGLLLIGSTCNSAGAQNAKQDTRPAAEMLKADKHALERLDSAPARSASAGHVPGKIRSFPSLSSLAAFLDSRGPVDLTSKATLVGLADVERTATSTRAVAALAKKGSAHKEPIQSVRLERAPNGTVSWMRGRIGSLDDVSAGKQASEPDYVEAALSAAASMGDLLKLKNPEDELRPLRTTRDALGYVHTRFTQTYKDIPIWGRDLYIHFDARGQMYAVNGTYEPTPTDVATEPTLSDDLALETVVADLSAQGRWQPLSQETSSWLGFGGPEIQLVLYPDADRGMRLAYEVTLHPNLLEWFAYLVDARTGEILNKIARHCTLYHEATIPSPIRVAGVPRPIGRSNPGNAAAFFDATAPDLNSQLQPLRVYQHDDAVFYMIWDLPNFDLSGSQLPDALAGGALTISAGGSDLDSDLTLTHVTSTDNTWTDSSGVSAHANMRTAYTYFKTTHDRNAIDDNDQSLISIIHVTLDGEPMDNAYWNGRVMAYGDGAERFSPLAGALDVAGHEMAHGVIDHSAELIYQFQPGALNESFADVFGVMVDREDMLLGEDITREATALRDLLNPDNPQILDQQPAHMDQYQNLTADVDNGGVHVNSGIPNRAAALVIQAIGHERTEQIYYRALTSYITRRSQFGDARIALEQAAADLFGASSDEVVAVQQAFDAVGILTTTGGGGELNEVPPQTGESLITFLLEDGSIGLVNVTDRDLLDPNDLSDVEILVFDDPAAKARGSSLDRAQLSTPQSGETIWFINQQNQLAYLNVGNGAVSVFEDVFIYQQGDLWNASISPDGSWVSIVSAYENDPRLYIFDGVEICCSLALEPETTQDDIPNQTLQYPDVVSWSPNPLVRRMAFDGYNEMSLESGTISYWSIYELDIVPQAVFNLFPGQSTNVSVGNITYSNTDPDVLAYNLFDEAGAIDVLVSDFDAGTTRALDVPSFSIDGQSISDAQRPTFSPDDSLVSMSSPAFGALLFTDREGSAVTSLALRETLGSAVYNPRWFARADTSGSGTDVEPEPELPGAFALLQNYPNPFNPTTTITYELPAAEAVRLAVHDVHGRLIATLVDQPQSAGRHEVRFDADGLASGVYFYRIETPSWQATRRLIVLK